MILAEWTNGLRSCLRTGKEHSLGINYGFEIDEFSSKKNSFEYDFIILGIKNI